MNNKFGIWNILGRVWAIWVILIFVITMLIFMIPFLLFCYFRRDPEKTNWFTRYSRVWMGVFLPLAGCPLRIKGKEKFVKGCTYIVVCNHNGLIDVPVTSPEPPTNILKRSVPCTARDLMAARAWVKRDSIWPPRSSCFWTICSWRAR